MVMIQWCVFHYVWLFCFNACLTFCMLQDWSWINGGDHENPIEICWTK